jgi:hypothetical protein
LLKRALSPRLQGGKAEHSRRHAAFSALAIAKNRPAAGFVDTGIRRLTELENWNAWAFSRAFKLEAVRLMKGEASRRHGRPASLIS